MTPALTNLKLALAHLLDVMDGLAPFSVQRRDLHAEAEVLRDLIRRLERKQAA